MIGRGVGCSEPLPPRHRETSSDWSYQWPPAAYISSNTSRHTAHRWHSSNGGWL